ncbi:MAG: cytochrome c [Pseudomonadota bacterium]|nr:cytochrome c [Pseudomonadota bacterium]
MKLLVLLALAGCGSARRTEPIAGPLALDEMAERGERVFFRYCHQCHPFGEGGVGWSLNEKPLPGFLIRAQTRAGVGAMPAFGRDQIGPDELDALVHYLVTLRKTR